MNKNDSPRLSNKLYEILRDILTSKTLFDKFSREFVENLNLEEEAYVSNL